MIFKKKFNTVEKKVYLAIWTCSVLYALYEFTRFTAKHFYQYDDFYEDFQTGWSVLTPRKQDTSDFEWRMICHFLRNIFPHLLVYLFISECLRMCTESIKVKLYFQLLWSLGYMLYFTGYIFTFLILFQPVFFSIAQYFFKTKNVIGTWACSLVSIILIHYLKLVFADETILAYLKLSHFDVYLNILAICWMNLKCTYYHLNISQKWDIKLYFAYCLYFPTIFTGPFLSYEDFLKTFVTKNFPIIAERLKKLGLNLARCVFWMLFTQVALHFVFVNATGFQNELVSKFTTWQLCGYGYAMGQFFHLKYIILYGLTCSLATFENIPVPALPRCIGRVHLYSDMWKFFDPGLYQFLKRCIFIPAVRKNLHKLIASLLCFLFVYIWHGIQEYIFIWASLNFIGICLESIVKNFYENRLKKVKIFQNLSGISLKRLSNTFAAPLLAMSAVSNFYFFAGRDIGHIFVEKLLKFPLLNQSLLLVALYCCCQVSTELRDLNAYQM